MKAMRYLVTMSLAVLAFMSTPSAAKTSTCSSINASRVCAAKNAVQQEAT